MFLGEEKCGLYSQDRETTSQEIKRIAMQEFLDDNEDYVNRRLSTTQRLVPIQYIHI